MAWKRSGVQFSLAPRFPCSEAMRASQDCSQNRPWHLYGTSARMPLMGMSEHEALVEIATGETVRGQLPRTARRLVEQWRAANVEELRANWALAQDR